MNYIIYITIIIAAIFGGVCFKLIQKWYFNKNNYQVSVFRKFGGKNQQITIRARKEKNKLVFVRNSYGMSKIDFPANEFIEVAYDGGWSCSVRIKNGIVTGWDKIESDKSKLCKELLTQRQRSFYSREYREAMKIKGKGNLRLIVNQIVIPFLLGMCVIGGIMGLESYFEEVADVSNQYNSQVNLAANTLEEMNELQAMQFKELRLAGVEFHNVQLNLSEVDSNDR